MKFKVSEIILDKILKEKEKEITGYAYESYCCIHIFICGIGDSTFY